MTYENSVSFKFHVRPTSAFSIKYKDKNDLYEKFLKKAKRHGFPVKSKFYASGPDGDIRVIRNADELSATLENHYYAKFYFPCPSVLDIFHPCRDCDYEEKKHKNEDGREVISERKKCSACTRSSSRKSVQCESDEDFCPRYVMPWEYWARFSYFCCHPHGYASGGLPQCENRVCPCKYLCKDFEKL